MARNTFAEDEMSNIATFERSELTGLLSFFNAMANKHKDPELKPTQIWEELDDVKDMIAGISSDDDLVLAFASERRKLESFSDMSRVLRNLTDSLDEETDRVEMQLRTAALHQGINKLLDDLLSVIFEYAASDFCEALWLSKVSSRFRAIMFSSPRIWANFELSTQSTAEANAAIARYSQGIPLVALLIPDVYTHCQIEAAVKDVLQYSAIIGELRVSMRNESSALQVFDQFKEIQMPLLHVLLIKVCYRNDEAIPERSDIVHSHVYELWAMPQLHNLECNFIPLPCLGSKLTRCVLDLDHHPFAVGRLLSFLGASQSLEVLIIKLIESDIYPEAGADPIVVLEKLRSLDISVTEHPPSLLLRRILGSLGLPNLQYLIFWQGFEFYPGNVSESEVEATELYAQHILRRDLVLDFVVRHKTLRWLIVRAAMRNSPYPQPDDPYPHRSLFPFRMFDRVHIECPSHILTLSLQSELWSICIQFGALSTHEFPGPVNFVDIANTRELTPEFLRLIRDKATRDGVPPAKVTVYRCPGVTEEDIRAVFPHSKIIFTPHEELSTSGEKTP